MRGLRNVKKQLSKKMLSLSCATDNPTNIDRTGKQEQIQVDRIN